MGSMISNIRYTNNNVLTAYKNPLVSHTDIENYVNIIYDCDPRTVNFRNDVTIDSLSWEHNFHCPICTKYGEEKTLSIFTLSEHMERHKYVIKSIYENPLIQKMMN